MNVLNTCITESLSPYAPSGSSPWNAAKARHVYNRIAFGAPESQIDQALTIGPQATIDNLINVAISLPHSQPTEWATWAKDDYTEDYSIQNRVLGDELYRIATSELRDRGFKARMSFFWLNHFVTQIESYFHAPYGFQYWRLMQQHAFGNFKEFVKEVSKSPAMLLFLNGFDNTNDYPNENFARELYELFTLGRNNGYTQGDIEETARALTGFNHETEELGQIYFNASTFDSGEKTIFGQTGNWNLDDVIDILFEQRGSQIAAHICTKLYTFFVSPVVHEDIIQQLTTTFIQNDFELLPVISQLLRSEHFFSEHAVGQLIKSPIDMHMTFHNQMGLTQGGTEEDFLNFFVYNCETIGQNLFNPVDVAGWQRDQDWINSSTLAGRWGHMSNYMFLHWDHSNEQYRELAKQISNDSADPEFIVSKFIEIITPKALFSEVDFFVAVDIFKWDVPSNYYDTGEWNLNYGSAPYQVLLLLQHLTRLPEFHLK